MSDSHLKPWSDNPNAPKISYDRYFEEKVYFAGVLLGSILYGIVIMLFFQCISALFSPTNRRGEAVKWGLVFYTVLMFAVVTTYTATYLNIQSISLIDNREFPGVEGLLPPGPVGYRWLIHSKALTGIIPNLMFLMGNWLADCLMLHRCYIFYSMNLWVIALPCLMFLASVAIGIVMLVQQTWQATDGIWDAVVIDFGLPYFSISISLNVILTLMIVIRLVLHSKDIHATLGAPGGISGLYKAIITMLIESSALYAVNSALVIGLWVAGNDVAEVFFPVLAEIQVIAPLLIIRRVANKSVLRNSTLVTGHIGPFHVMSQGESTGGGGTSPGGNPAGWMDEDRKSSGELEIGTMEFRRVKV